MKKCKVLAIIENKTGKLEEAYIWRLSDKEFIKQDLKENFPNGTHHIEEIEMEEFETAEEFEHFISKVNGYK